MSASCGRYVAGCPPGPAVPGLEGGGGGPGRQRQPATRTLREFRAHFINFQTDTNDDLSGLDKPPWNSTNRHKLENGPIQPFSHVLLPCACTSPTPKQQQRHHPNPENMSMSPRTVAAVTHVSTTSAGTTARLRCRWPSLIDGPHSIVPARRPTGSERPTPSMCSPTPPSKLASELRELLVSSSWPATRRKSDKSLHVGLPLVASLVSDATGVTAASSSSTVTSATTGSSHQQSTVNNSIADTFSQRPQPPQQRPVRLSEAVRPQLPSATRSVDEGLANSKRFLLQLTDTIRREEIEAAERSELRTAKRLARARAAERRAVASRKTAAAMAAASPRVLAYRKLNAQNAAQAYEDGVATAARRQARYDSEWRPVRPPTPYCGRRAGR